MNSQRPRRQPVSGEIDEAVIKALVHGFYDKIRLDAELGPIFDRVIGAGWDEHLAKMCSFWSSVMLLTGRYKGNPMIAHMRLKMVAPRHFDRWLALFRESAAQICPPGTAELFIAKAETIARSLQLGMFYRPGNPEPASLSATQPPGSERSNP